MKIHLGCGKHYLKGWYNIDAERHKAAPRDPDLFADITQPLPLPDGQAKELMAIHLLEHFYEWEVPGVLREWSRVLAPGGRIILEMPDVMKAAKNLLDGRNDQFSMWPLYGDNTLHNPLMCHKWGWCFDTLKPYLERAGFEQIVERPTEWHGRKQDRDFRIEGVKRC